MIKFKVVKTTEVIVSEEDFQEWLNNVAESVGCDSDGLDSKTAIEDYLLEDYDSMDAEDYTSDIEFHWSDETSDETIQHMLNNTKAYIKAMDEEYMEDEEEDMED